MIKKIIVLALAFVMVAHAVSGMATPLSPEDQYYYEKEFMPWLQKYQHHYSNLFDRNDNSELMSRFAIWKESYQTVVLHNRDPHRTYDMGLTAYAAMTFEEFKQKVALDDVMAPQFCSATAAATRGRPKRTINPADYPPSLDWRQRGVVTPVKNQGQCGSCWAFSTTGCLESHWAIRRRELVLLSEQQLVDCAGAFDNHGCQGGLPSYAFEYIKHNGGIVSSKAYPYTAKDEECKFNPVDVVAKTRGSHNITEYAEDEILEAVATVGPVAIGYEVVSDFRLYKNGVYQSKDCKQGPMDVNHAVLIVGYGTTAAGVPYWIVKNSWGVEFGMEGYFWMLRGANMCGLAVCASYPLI